jgi:hypothetical protein
MASVRKRSWKTSLGEIKTAWVVDYVDNRGDRQRKNFGNKKAADHSVSVSRLSYRREFTDRMRASCRLRKFAQIF